MSGITHSGDSNTRFAIKFNGNNNASHSIADKGGGSFAPTVITTQWYMNAGDYAEATVYQDGQAHGCLLYTSPSPRDKA